VLDCREAQGVSSAGMWARLPAKMSTTRTCMLSPALKTSHWRGRDYAMRSSKSRTEDHNKDSRSEITFREIGML